MKRFAQSAKEIIAEMLNIRCNDSFYNVSFIITSPLTIDKVHYIT